jgi:hypothetical protein
MASAGSLATIEPSKREEVAIIQVAERLQERFPSVPEDQIEQTVRAEYHRFDGSPIRDFVPIFVERNAREDLLAFVVP